MLQVIVSRLIQLIRITFSSITFSFSSILIIEPGLITGVSASSKMVKENWIGAFSREALPDKRGSYFYFPYICHFENNDADICYNPCDSPPFIFPRPLLSLVNNFFYLIFISEEMTFLLNIFFYIFLPVFKCLAFVEFHIIYN